MKRIIAILLVLSLSSTDIKAGSYICYAYRGTVGKDSVIFYFQTARRFSTMKDADLPSYATLLFKKNNDPMPFGGIMVKDNKVRLNRDKKNDQRIEFAFINHEKIQGIFCVGNEKKEINLVKTGELTDTIYKGKVLPIDILMAASMKNVFFMATYEKIEDPYNAQMKKLKIINKVTGKLLQEIDFSAIETMTGNVLSNIFLNVETGDYNHDGYEDLLIWNHSGKMGSSMHALFDPKTEKFVLNPELRPAISKQPKT